MATRTSPRGARCPIDSTVMHTPTIVADVGRYGPAAPFGCLAVATIGFTLFVPAGQTSSTRADDPA